MYLLIAILVRIIFILNYCHLSHLPIRKETNCLNCTTEVVGRFCHVCGQENLEPKETVWHLVSHFFQDVTHFDGKFFTSLKDLILKPGFLSKEYIIGRRTSYLNPIRMYLFTSAIFFLIFFYLFKIDADSIKTHASISNKTYDEILQMDSAQLIAFTKNINNGKPMSRKEVLSLIDSSFQMAPGHYRSREEYDSLLKSGAKKHNWIERQLTYKNFDLKEKYGSNAKVILPAVFNRFEHTIPQILFILLPLFALILKLVYIRRNQFFYVDHVIFTIHFYIFVFLMMLLIFGVVKIKGLLHWNWLDYLEQIFTLCILFYLYKALRNFYQQSRGKTIVKYLILLLSFAFTTTLLFIIFFFFSIFEI